MLQHAPLLWTPIPGSSTSVMQSKTPSIYQQRQESFDELIHGKRNYSFLLIRTTQLVPTRLASTDWLRVIQVSDQIAVVQWMLTMNIILFKAFLQQAFKTLMLCISVKRRGEGEVGTPNRSHYQYPVLRCDPVFGWNSRFSPVFSISRPRRISMFYSWASKRKMC